jgi:predicted Zn-dependent protease
VAVPNPARKSASDALLLTFPNILVYKRRSEQFRFNPAPVLWVQNNRIDYPITGANIRMCSMDFPLNLVQVVSDEAFASAARKIFGTSK